MNKIIKLARKNDYEAKYALAYKLYLEAIEHNEAELKDYLSVSVIAFLFNDPGFSFGHKISSSLINESYYEMTQTLEKAKVKFGENFEIDFWLSHYSLFFGEEEIEIDCEDYVSKGCLIALVGIDRKEPKYDSQRLQLKKLIHAQDNALKRYVYTLMNFKPNTRRHLL